MRPVDAEQNAGDLGAPAANETSETEYLARVQRKRDVAKRAIPRQVARLENGLANPRVSDRIV